LEYVLGTIAGIIYGGLVGFFKYFCLWRKLLKEGDDTVTMKKMSVRLIVSYVINFVTLIITYFVRNVIPFDFVAFAVATALALSLAGRFFPIQKILQRTQI
jgi:small-conductance mechanosensitive channel